MTAPAITAKPTAAQLGLTADECALYEERAAILEFEAGIPRKQAEQLALKEILRARLKW